MGYSADKILSLKGSSRIDGMTKPNFDALSTDHHKQARALIRYRQRLAGECSFDPKTIGEFMDVLGLAGLSTARRVYASRLPYLLDIIKDIWYLVRPCLESSENFPVRQKPTAKN